MSRNQTIVFVIAIAVFISVQLVHGQSQTNDTNKEGSFLGCYQYFITSFLNSNIITPFNIDVTDPDIKEYYANLCLAIHDRIGSWNMTIGNLKKYGYNNSMYDLVDPYEFGKKYYPNGFPDSVQKMIDSIIKYGYIK